MPQKQKIINYPLMSVLVPCYNEEELIKDKVSNLTSLDYPKGKLEIIFLDGLSTDFTFSKVQKAIKNVPYMKIIQTNVRGKIHQINKILPKIKSGIIVITDVDAFLKKNSLIELVREFQSDPKVMVVGAMVFPQDALAEEVQYWKVQNQIRILESQACSSSIVIANCYAFRRGLIKSFPEDVVADDIYIPFYANSKGFRTVYSPNVVTYERRAPRTMSDLIKHKFRKANAWMIETLRFLYQLPKLNPFWKMIFLTKAFQLLGLPWFLLAFLLMTISLGFLSQYKLILWLLGILLVSLWVAHSLIASVKLPEEKAGNNILLELKMFLIMTSLLLFSAVAYPFYKQNSKYQKLN
jgi:cellulose synthase/poly-beta-1,6-N-acetylglucosamine synthase-like glycosyltransferase